MDVGRWILKKIRGKKRSNQITNNPVITNNFSPNIQFVVPSGPNGNAADSMSANNSHNITYYINGNPHHTTSPTAISSQTIIASPIAPSTTSYHSPPEPTSVSQVPSQPMIASPIAPPSIPRELPRYPVISLPVAPPTAGYRPIPETSTVPQELPSQPVITSPAEPQTTNDSSNPETSKPQDLPSIPVPSPKISSSEDTDSFQTLQVPAESISSAVQPPENICPPLQPTIEPQEPIVEWVKTTFEKAYLLSDRAVIASDRGFDNSPQWVIRAWFDDDLLPGALSIVHEYAQVPWGGHQYFVDDIEVCCASRDSVRWVEASYGAVPPRAVRAGHTNDGEPLYVGRAWQDGYLSPGKVHPSHKKLYIPFRCSEIGHHKYEVLCIA